ncbi:hypothetical protein HETIRDRAFT_173988 [Heterobasidion irregulare TC 32-1]|uniref:GIY-YIG domain-containing protein n=1 Tax=Heterobasidion irregulare (strain TC 32-1) TaxID=747525 RepID=W4JWX6_HETIT|nr:uncharacterized protein HETIRDRAFT_173988 [Heterobasidion irregulare TC 32-1]ETW77371.1 hypothetical protein HETIRDRAFT_173988 [Heterobasidion irregulare TC 32-1]
MATKRSKSSLRFHQFPQFYACYLLKSIRTPRSTATYIGSTPSPPRRIRQHNGEITQGAWKTKHNRPWVMHMIVYGFPSKLAALQFEWAWQHPHISRHLRDESGGALFRRSKYLKMSIQVARTMIACRPYNTWPLHVKLFTEDAVKIWKDVDKDVGARALPLPAGFTIQIELEGVDGKSGRSGSGRDGPIDVSDAAFTTAHLAKHDVLLTSGRHLRCSVCRKPLTTYSTDPLTTALCSSTECNAVSHLSCLSQHFLASQGGIGMIPRGGRCLTCQSYTLWGDIIKGCYRRYAGKAVPDDDGVDEEEEDAFGSEPGNESLSDTPVTPRRHKAPQVRAVRRAAATSASGDEGNHLNLGPRSGALLGPSNQVSGRQLKGPKARYHTDIERTSSDEEFFDLNAISEDDRAPSAPAFNPPASTSYKIPPSKKNSTKQTRMRHQSSATDMPRNFRGTTDSTHHFPARHFNSEKGDYTASALSAPEPRSPCTIAQSLKTFPMLPPLHSPLGSVSPRSSRSMQVMLTGNDNSDVAAFKKFDSRSPDHDWHDPMTIPCSSDDEVGQQSNLGELFSTARALSSLSISSAAPCPLLHASLMDDDLDCDNSGGINGKQDEVEVIELSD